MTLFNAIKKDTPETKSTREIRAEYEQNVFWPNAIAGTAQAIQSGSVSHEDALHVLLVNMRARGAGKYTVDQKAVEKALQAALKS